MNEQSTDRDYSELGFVALLGVAAALLVYDALTLHTPEGRAGEIGPEVVPLVVAAMLSCCAVLLTIQVFRGRRGEAEGGEDIDLSSPIEWSAVIPLVLVMIANALLIDVVGWVIAGTLLFWGSLWALGSRTYLRDLVISVGMAVATFYGFYSGLGIYLPAGPLEGVL